jgi:hypothetical protein
MAAFLLSASKKGISAHQMHRMLGITYKSAWFMMHRLREAMTPAKPGPLGGEGKVVEADETYMGKRDGKRGKPDTFVSGFGWVKHPRIETQRKVVALVERGGPVRSFVVNSVDKKTVRKILFTNADRKSVLMTDEAHVYSATGAHFADHQTVRAVRFRMILTICHVASAPFWRRTESAFQTWAKRPHRPQRPQGSWAWGDS